MVMNLLRQSIDFRQGEGTATALLFLLSFFKGLSVVALETGANSAFLAAHPYDELPRLYLIASLITTAAGIFYRKLARFHHTALIVRLTMAITVFSVSVFALLAWFSDFHFARSLMVYKDMHWVILNLMFWATAASLLDLRQGKRLYPVIAAGDMLAIALGGSLIFAIHNFSDLKLLLLVAAVAVIIVNIIFNKIFLLDQRAFFRRPEKKSRVSSRHLSESSRYSIFIYAISAISLVAFYFLDFLFMREVNLKYPDDNDLTGFFSGFYAIGGFINLFIALFLSGKLNQRFGIQSGMILFPATMLVLLSVFTVAGFTLPFQYIFIIIVIARLADDIFRYSIEGPAYRALTQLYDKDQKLKVQSARDMIAEPLAASGAGLLLVMAYNTFNISATTLSIVLSAIILLWLIIGIILKKEYIRRLQWYLTSKGDKKITINFKEEYSKIKSYLFSKNNDSVLFCLKLLSRQNPGPISELFLDDITLLLRHNDPEVKRQAIYLLRHIHPPAINADLEQIYQQETQPSVKEQLVLLTGYYPQYLPFLERLMHSEPGQTAAIAAYLINRNPDNDKTRQLLQQYLHHLKQTCSDFEVKKRQIDLIRLTSLKVLTPWLKELLYDPDLKIKRMALASVSYLPAAELSNDILILVKEKTLSSTANKALALLPGFDKQAAEYLTLPAIPAGFKAQMASVLRYAGHPDSVAILKSLLGHKDMRLMRAAAAALVDFRKRDLFTISVQQLDQSITRIAEEIMILLILNNYTGNKKHDKDLVKAIEAEINSLQKEVFGFMALYVAPQTASRARVFYLQKEKDKKAVAIETVENMAPAKIKPKIPAILEDIDTEERLNVMFNFIDNRYTNLDAILKTLLNNEAVVFSDWITSAILNWLAHEQKFEYKEQAIALSQSGSGVIKETAGFYLETASVQ